MCNSNGTIEQTDNLLNIENRKIDFTKNESILSIAIAVISFLFIKFVLCAKTGFISTAVYIILITTIILYLKKNKMFFSKINKIIAASLYLFSFVFSITDNSLIKGLNTFFMFICGAYFIYSVTADKKQIEKFLPYALIKAVFEYPFSEFTAQKSIAREITSKSKFSSNLKFISIGLIATIPLTGIVGVLLMSADHGLESMINSIINFMFSSGMIKMVVQMAIAVPCSFYLFGMIYSNTFREKIVPLNDIECENKMSRKRAIQNIIMYTAVTPICILYVMFFISQANYFLSAFYGNLPSGYTYSDYARKGFFELFAIVLINLGVIIIINLFSSKCGKSKPFALKLYSVILCTFTLILIATAISKMVMYISEYGLTQLRVYTTWFMLLCAMIFIIIIIKQFKTDFAISRSITLGFVLMFGLLCFSRPDALIVKYNVKMYNAGIISRLDTNTMLNMSDDAVAAAVKYNAVSKEQVIKSKNNEYNNDIYNRFNISSMIVYSKIN